MIIRISEAKVSLKDKTHFRTQINANFIDIRNANERRKRKKKETPWP
jgi:hypothetical protein